MNFDDLHDPDPPRAGIDTLAAVAGRARQIRRRRTALIAGGGVLAALAIAVPAALLVTGEDASDRMVPATLPTDAVPPTDVAATTVAPTTASPTTVSPTTGPEPTTTSSLATTTSTTTTTVAPVRRPTVVAVRADGDAVSIDAAGVETVLYDEYDVTDPSVEGGDSVGVESIAVTGDGRQFVGLCCEPVIGAWFEVGAEDGPARYGRKLDVSPDGTRLAAAGAGFVGVFAPDGTILADADVSASAVYTQLEQAMWLDDDTLALLAFQEGPEFRLLTADAALGDIDPMAGVVISALPAPEAPWPLLGGVGDDGSILVFQGAGEDDATTVLQAYDPVTLERREGSDVAIPEPATFAWLGDGVLTWIGVDRSLHVGEAVVPGEYLWARTIDVR